MATKKKAVAPGSQPGVKPAASKLNGKAISARATGTPEARDTARLLLEIEAIHCRPDNPYIFTSGRASPVYIDCRKLISYPEARAKIMNYALKSIDKQIGWNKIVFIEALKKAEAKVADCFVIFHYGIFPQSIEMLAAAGVKLHALATWWDALEAAQKHKYFDERGLVETKAFLEAPEQWSANHGGRPPAPRPML